LTTLPPVHQQRLKSEKRLIRRGVAWNAVGMMIGRGSSILAKVVLARFLLPEYFGFYNMVMVFSAIVTIVADLGFRFGLVQRQRDQRTKLLYDSAFWLLFAASLVMIGIMWLAGVRFVVWFFGEPRLAPIALAMSAIIIFQNLQVVPEARLARVMRFKQIATADIIGTLIGCTASILLAIAGANVWSLVAQTLIAAFLLSLTVIAAYVMRVVFVALISVSAALSTNVSYMIWYNFPADYTLGYMSIEIIGGIVAGLVIAWWLTPKAA